MSLIAATGQIGNETSITTMSEGGLIVLSICAVVLMSFLLLPPILAGRAPRQKGPASPMPQTGPVQGGVHAGDGRNLRRLELCIATRDHHEAIGRLPLDLPDEVAALLVGIIRHRTGIDHIHIGGLVEFPPDETFVLQHPGETGCLRIVELASQCVEGYGLM